MIQFGKLCIDKQDKTLNTGIIRRTMRMYNRCKADTVIKTGARKYVEKSSKKIITVSKTITRTIKKCKTIVTIVTNYTVWQTV